MKQQYIPTNPTHSKLWSVCRKSVESLLSFNILSTIEKHKKVNAMAIPYTINKKIMFKETNI